MTDDLIDLSEDISELWDFIPLNKDSEIGELLLQNTLIRKEKPYYNNICLNVCNFYVYILHCLLCRLYKLDENNIELLKYIQITKSVFCSAEEGEQVVISDSQHINAPLFFRIENDAFDYFLYLMNVDKGCCGEYGTHKAIFKIRNQAAHLNYTPLSYENFQSLVTDIKNNLSFWASQFYQKMKSLMYDEITPLIEEQLIDSDNYENYFVELNRNYNISPYDYNLFLKNNLFADAIQGTYKEYLKKYIEDVLKLSENEE